MFLRRFPVLAVLPVVIASGMAAAQPSNNDCSNAIPVYSGTTSFTNAWSTTDGPMTSPCYNQSPVFLNDVWFRYVNYCPGPVTVSTCGSSFDTMLEVFTACGTAPLACDDDSGGCGAGSALTFNASQGQAYYIRVGGFNGATGPGKLSITSTCPTSQFTYQGRLLQNDQPVSGPHDLRFSVHSQATGVGTSLSGYIGVPGVGVDDGLFSTTVPVPVSVFQNGGTTFLQVDVLDPGTNTYWPMLPRQPITQAPMASWAAKAANGGEGGVFVYNLTTPAIDYGAPIAAVSWTTVPTSSINLTLPAGTATLNWSLSGQAASVGGAFYVRPVIGNMAGPAVPWVLVTLGEHSYISGTCAIPVAAGNQPVRLEMQRITNGGGVGFDAWDSVSWTITVHKQ